MNKSSSINSNTKDDTKKSSTLKRSSGMLSSSSNEKSTTKKPTSSTDIKTINIVQTQQQQVNKDTITSSLSSASISVSDNNKYDNDKYDNNKGKEIELYKPSQVTEYHYTPKGILLSGIIRMIKYGIVLSDGKTIVKVDKEWTTEKLVFEIVRPNSMNLSTNQQWAIFTDIVKDRSLISPIDFEAVFVSHAWAYNFVELLGILERKYEGYI